jgi:hypothetical protein
MILELVAIASSAVSFGLWLDLNRKVKKLEKHGPEPRPETREEAHARRQRLHEETVAKARLLNS